MISSKQKDFLKTDLKRINLLYGSVRSGKTWISLLKWALWIGEQPKEQEFLMVGKTITTLKRNCLGLLQELIGNNVYYNTSKKEARIFGHTVWLEGASDARSESKIRGMTLKGIYIDELTQIPKDFYLMALSRLSLSGAVLIATTNPDAPTHYVKTDIIDNKEIDSQICKFLLDDNIFLDSAYKENLKKEYGSQAKVYYQRFILGEFVRAEGIIFPSIAENEKQYFIQESELPKAFENIEVGFDIGGNGSAYALTCTARSYSGVYYVLKSKKIQAGDLNITDIEKIVSEFCKECEKYGYIECINSDHIAAIINSINDETEYRAVLTYKPPLEDRPFIISKLLANKRLWFVEGQCYDLIDELQNLVFDEKSDKMIPLDDGSMQIDTWDSLIYSISNDWNYLTVRE